MLCSGHLMEKVKSGLLQKIATYFTNINTRFSKLYHKRKLLEKLYCYMIIKPKLNML